MKREDIKTLLVIAIGIALIIIAIRFFIAILPVIIVLLIDLLIYDSYQRNKGKPVNKSKKDNKLKEAEIIKEKNID